jgi:hypothetical protein
MAPVGSDPQAVGDHRAGAVRALMNAALAAALDQQPRTHEPLAAQQRPNAPIDAMTASRRRQTLAISSASCSAAAGSVV